MRSVILCFSYNYPASGPSEDDIYHHLIQSPGKSGKLLHCVLTASVVSGHQRQTQDAAVSTIRLSDMNDKTVIKKKKVSVSVKLETIES